MNRARTVGVAIAAGALTLGTAAVGIASADQPGDKVWVLCRDGQYLGTWNQQYSPPTTYQNTFAFRVSASASEYERRGTCSIFR